MCIHQGIGRLSWLSLGLNCQLIVQTSRLPPTPLPSLHTTKVGLGTSALSAVDLI